MVRTALYLDYAALQILQTSLNEGYKDYDRSFKSLKKGVMLAKGLHICSGEIDWSTQATPDRFDSIVPARSWHVRVLWIQHVPCGCMWHFHCGAGLTIKPLSCVALRQVRSGRQRRAVARSRLGIAVYCWFSCNAPAVPIGVSTCAFVCVLPVAGSLAPLAGCLALDLPDFIYLGTLQNVETRSVGAAVTPSVAVSVAVVCCDVLLLQQLLLLLLLPVLVVVVVVVVGRA